jgi:hypothetical protein
MFLGKKEKKIDPGFGKSNTVEAIKYKFTFMKSQT